MKFCESIVLRSTACDERSLQLRIVEQPQPATLMTLENVKRVILCLW